MNNETIDLFEHYELIPTEVNEVFEKYDLLNGDSCYSYNTLEKCLSEIQKLGYSFEYGLDGQPYYLTKLTTIQ